MIVTVTISRLFLLNFVRCVLFYGFALGVYWVVANILTNAFAEIEQCLTKFESILWIRKKFVKKKSLTW